MTDQEQYQLYHDYYINNRERIIARQKAYYQAHKRERNEYRARYYAENKEYILAKQRFVYHEKKRAANGTGNSVSGK